MSLTVINQIAIANILMSIVKADGRVATVLIQQRITETRFFNSLNNKETFKAVDMPVKQCLISLKKLDKQGKIDASKLMRKLIFADGEENIIERERYSKACEIADIPVLFNNDK